MIHIILWNSKNEMSLFNYALTLKATAVENNLLKLNKNICAYYLCKGEIIINHNEL